MAIDGQWLSIWYPTHMREENNGPMARALIARKATQADADLIGLAETAKGKAASGMRTGRSIMETIFVKPEERQELGRRQHEAVQAAIAQRYPKQADQIAALERLRELEQAQAPQRKRGMRL